MEHINTSNIGVILGQNDVHARFLLTEQLDEPSPALAWSVLSDEERSRHDAFRLDRDRRDFLAAHSLLRTSLSRYADVSPDEWTFERDTHGKPRLADRYAGLKLTFNLSHARGLVACAIAAGPAVGIDVEAVDQTVDWASAIERCFTPFERQQLDQCSPPDRAARFAALWTLKEAFIKATGKGLSEPLLGFAFDVGSNAIRFTPPSGVQADAWHFAMFAPTPAYCMSVAVNAADQQKMRVTCIPPLPVHSASPHPPHR